MFDLNMSVPTGHGWHGVEKTCYRINLLCLLYWSDYFTVLWWVGCQVKIVRVSLVLLSFSVSSTGTFAVNVTQTSYQAEENHNITLEWTFTTTTDTSCDSLFIFCEMKTDHKVSVLFELRGGVVVPESRDQQFVGRVQLDKDVLRDGRLRLHVSRLRTRAGTCVMWGQTMVWTSWQWSQRASGLIMLYSSCQIKVIDVKRIHCIMTHLNWNIANRSSSPANEPLSFTIIFINPVIFCGYKTTEWWNFTFEPFGHVFFKLVLTVYIWMF